MVTRMILLGDLVPAFKLVEMFDARHPIRQGRLVDVPDDLLDEYGELMIKWRVMQDRLAVLPSVVAVTENGRNSG